MRAALFDAPGQPLIIGEVEAPQPLSTDLLVKVKACGICGTDLHLAAVTDRSGGMAPLGQGSIMGHEFCGEVVEVGSQAQKSAGGSWHEGDRVCALPYIACGQCLDCLAGRGHRCAGAAYNGMGSLAGGYADYVRVGGAEALALPQGVDYQAGALVEPLAVGLHAVRAANLRPGEAVLIVGGGPIGLAVALWCRFFGARHVVISDLLAGRLDKAVAMGATDGIDASREDVIGRYKQIAGSRADVIFDCVGVTGSQQLAMDYAPMNGRVVVAGVCMRPDTVMPVKAITKELQVNYVYMYERRDFELALEMLDRARIDASAMITDVVGFDAFSAAFEGLKTPSDQCKILLDPQR
ncbi:MAG: alcohol dehydrogenase catalytic domain-containing protein [Rhodospirillaceae bacterium]|jgi:(R,R)-butanediol dehydrogenase/meso-butanediol dehydrogenase/diacetyl reductase|nr:alcohol dehydrogenase catalytic domain-containing protein [Rhodospirillaceae bacterium]MBT4690383.1 alcohol dehydrogenase catalytic domain-containing protein [Rhodospirillaceae bacterium]MBT5083994.1 alcohol dehydrogenase catalytic domain-containing protein [Rhodospirillaceae bacterium]MBT5523904.1 alcohol dehydrogenase catalytic domain-containing protein [Rhodospirillaceae bacterium]MBT5882193.1 alcohol dehydrogenase catalytic domain-containing protein [Rhodospirillaceae bacterium]